MAIHRQRIPWGASLGEICSSFSLFGPPHPHSLFKIIFPFHIFAFAGASRIPPAGWPSRKALCFVDSCSLLVCRRGGSLPVGAYLVVPPLPQDETFLPLPPPLNKSVQICLSSETCLPPHSAADPPFPVSAPQSGCPRRSPLTEQPHQLNRRAGLDCFPSDVQGCFFCVGVGFPRSWGLRVPWFPSDSPCDSPIIPPNPHFRGRFSTPIFTPPLFCLDPPLSPRPVVGSAFSYAVALPLWGRGLSLFAPGWAVDPLYLSSFFFLSDTYDTLP